MKTLFLSSPTLKDRIVIDLKQTPAQLAETKKNPSMSAYRSPRLRIADEQLLSKKVSSTLLELPFRKLSWARVKLIPSVEGEIVSGLKYLQVVKRAGLTVDKTEAMLGSYGPQQEEYTKIVSHPPVGFDHRRGLWPFRALLDLGPDTVDSAHRNQS